MPGDLYFYPLAFNVRDASALAGPIYSYAPAAASPPGSNFSYQPQVPKTHPPSADYGPATPPASPPPQLAPAANQLVPYAVVYTSGASSFSVDPHGGGFLVSRIFENANVSHLIVVVSDHHTGVDPQVVLGPTHTLPQGVMQIAERGFPYRFPRKSPRETKFYFIRVGKSIMWTQDPKGTWHLAGPIDFHVCEVGTTYNEITDRCVPDALTSTPHIPMLSPHTLRQSS